jgi:hypothetical protein
MIWAPISVTSTRARARGGAKFNGLKIESVEITPARDGGRHG